MKKINTARRVIHEGFDKEKYSAAVIIGEVKFEVELKMDKHQMNLGEGRIEVGNDKRKKIYISTLGSSILRKGQNYAIRETYY